jgi:hypothetical protein
MGIAVHALIFFLISFVAKKIPMNPQIILIANIQFGIRKLYRMPHAKF